MALQYRSTRKGVTTMAQTTLDLSNFDSQFDAANFIDWNRVEEGWEIVGQIEKIDNAKNYADLKIYTARARYSDKSEKTIKFTAYSSMQTQFDKFHFTVGSVFYLKHVGRVDSLKFKGKDAWSCIVKDLTHVE